MESSVMSVDNRLESSIVDAGLNGASVVSSSCAVEDPPFSRGAGVTAAADAAGAAAHEQEQEDDE